jgi:hypothetical protein
MNRQRLADHLQASPGTYYSFEVDAARWRRSGGRRTQLGSWLAVAVTDRRGDVLAYAVLSSKPPAAHAARRLDGPAAARAAETWLRQRGDHEWGASTDWSRLLIGDPARIAAGV